MPGEAPESITGAIIGPGARPVAETIAAPADAARLIIISGSSGAGKSVALHTLEDLGFYCIDNLPISLLAEIPNHLGAEYKHIAVGIDVRSALAGDMPLRQQLAALPKADLTTEIIFLDADDEVLTKRFSETRRKHPLSSARRSLAEAILDERRLLGAISANADLYIDTSAMSVHGLRTLTRQRIARDKVQGLSLQLLSFGFKHGVPRDADFIFDVRCLPNPHWHKHLRQLSGLDESVMEFLAGQPAVAEMLADIAAFVNKWTPAFIAENRSYLTLAIGCTGGHHRSVYLVEKLAAMLDNGLKDSLDDGPDNSPDNGMRKPLITHRDL